MTSVSYFAANALLTSAPRRSVIPWIAIRLMTKPSIDALTGFVDSARNVVLAVGLLCIVVLPMHLPYSEVGWLVVVLWACLAFLWA